MNKLGISISPNNFEMLPAYAAAGFEVIEIAFLDWSYEETRAFAQRVLETARQLNLPVWSVHPSFGKKEDLSEPDEEKRLLAIERSLPFIELSKELGAKVIVVHGSTEPYRDEERGARIIACAQSLKVLQKAAGDIPIALENLPRTCIARTSGEALPLSKNCGGICFDVNHLLMQSHESFLDQTAERIITTHLSDYDGINERHWMPGAGIVPWKLVCDRLLAAGYSGPWMFEVVKNPDGSFVDPFIMVDTWKQISGLPY